MHGYSSIEVIVPVLLLVTKSLTDQDLEKNAVKRDGMQFIYFHAAER